jgi:multidrug resistance efflux pump
MWKWIVIVLAALGAIGGVVTAMRSQQAAPVPPLAREPVRNPYPHAIAGAGLIEPESENIVIGAPEPGIVTKLWAEKGTVVKKGDPLFQIDARPLESQKLAADAAVRSAEAELSRVKSFRRPEEEPALKAKVDELTAAVAQSRQEIVQAEASVAESDAATKDAEAKLTRVAALVGSRSVSEQDFDVARFDAEMARARRAAATARVGATKASLSVAEARDAEAQAELDLFHAGPWGPDVARADATLAEARAGAERLRLDIERRIVRAPADATVLRCYIHEGEYVVAGAPQADQAALVLGDVSRLRVRVDIDEFDASRFHAGAAATAFLKGQPKPAIALEFVETEPFVAPKRALTNSQRELVDTRVLQVIYRLTGPHPPVYAGQQVDVFIETPEGSE